MREWWIVGMIKKSMSHDEAHSKKNCRGVPLAPAHASSLLEHGQHVNKDDANIL